MLETRPAGWVTELAVSALIVDPVQRYPGKATVIARRHLIASAMLDEADDALLALHADVLRAARAVRAVTGAARVNLALFANLAPHVHWHLVPRFDDGDRAAPDLAPHPDVMAGAAVLDGLAARLRAALQGAETV